MSGTEPSPLLRAERLTKRFGSGRTLVRAVSGIDLAVDAGEVLLIVGPSGAGKTTLLTMIGALLRPTEGRVVIDGRDVTAIGARELPQVRRDCVGFVFQNSNLLEALTAQENVEIALNVGGVSGAAAHARARELLVGADLEDRLDFRVRDLSGGERQRVSIARALANRPRLLLADEPTANLDSHHGRDVMELLRRLAKQEGCGVVIVSHDDRLRRIADRVLTLEDGRIAGPAGRESEVGDLPGAASLPSAGGHGQGQA